MAERERKRDRTTAEAALSTSTRPVLGPAGTCRNPSSCLSHLYMFHEGNTLSRCCFFPNFRELKNGKRERGRERKKGRNGETVEPHANCRKRTDWGKRHVFMELILGRILLRSSNMKHNEMSKHSASVYARSFPGCKNICE